MIENTNIQENIRSIKKDLRLSMNGVVSTLQRNQGLNYKINFGVEIPRLKGIAARYEKSEELAMALWSDNIRECKMLAIFLMPEESYGKIACRMVDEVPYTEIADHLAKEILCRISGIEGKAISWLAEDEGLHSYCGYMTLSHLFRKGILLTAAEEREFINAAVKKIKAGAHSPTAKAAYNSLMLYSDNGEEYGKKVEEALEDA